jgi:hypothetical protein
MTTIDAADLKVTDALAKELYSEWREFFDLAAMWQDLNQDRRDGWRAVAIRAQLVARVTALEAGSA